MAYPRIYNWKMWFYDHNKQVQTYREKLQELGNGVVNTVTELDRILHTTLEMQLLDAEIEQHSYVFFKTEIVEKLNIFPIEPCWENGHNNEGGRLIIWIRSQTGVTRQHLKYYWRLLLVNLLAWGFGQMSEYINGAKVRWNPTGGLEQKISLWTLADMFLKPELQQELISKTREIFRNQLIPNSSVVVDNTVLRHAERNDWIYWEDVQQNPPRNNNPL